MKAVILAGGRGTRLAHLTKEVPKPMIPLLGKPLLQYQIELCKKYHIEEVILIVNHLKQPIIDYFGDGTKFGIPISYFEEHEPLGTVGGVKEVEDQLTDDFLVLYGDVMMDMDLHRLAQFHKENDSEATLVVHPNDHPYDSDLVEMDADERIVKILPKPHPQGIKYHNMVNAAVYLFSSKVLDLLEKGKKADFGKDIFPSIYNKLRMFGYNTTEYLKDMGTPDRLEQVENDIKTGKVARRSFENAQKAIYLDRDGVINKDNHLIHQPEQLELYAFAAEAIKKINRSDYLSVVATNQSVVARNLTTIEGLGEIHKKMETELGNERAKLDAIYYCPHHPDKGYPEENPDYKIDCECRKPKPGMLLQAAEKFNIDTSLSYMIGDNGTDIEAGKAAGCTTVGVKTGSGLKKTSTLPDYLFNDLLQAVDFIIKEPHQELYRDLKAKALGSKAPYIMSIGGNSRSGKSTLATYLQKSFELEGKKVLRINLDHWILPRDQRLEEVDVFHNFQLPKLESDIRKIVGGESVRIEGYQPHQSWSQSSILYNLMGHEIILIEGVVALSSVYLRQIAHQKIFMQLDQKTLKNRIFSFYEWKGYPEEDVLKLWNQRKPNEYDIIEKDVEYADVVI